VINHAGGAITWLGLGYDIGFGEVDAPQFNVRRYVGCFCGGAALIRREVFQELGGFDKSYFAYLEDVDLSWRVALRGYRVLYEPLAVVQHQYGASFGARGSLQREYLCERNRWSTLVKNIGSSRLIPLLLASLGFHVLKTIEHFILARPAHGFAMMKGFRDALGILPYLLRQRKAIQRFRTVTDEQLANQGTIVPLLDAVRERIRLGWASYSTGTQPERL
jgi:GT2 family glycosyltransferase